MTTKIDCCRICKEEHLDVIMDLGMHRLSSRFPTQNEPEPIEVPLVLVKCTNEDCNLLQLSHNTSEDELYLQHYGYRSGLNNTMIHHLKSLVDDVKSKVKLDDEDIVLDIGSNDSTLLQNYSNVKCIGIDPTGTQFKQYYPEHIHLIPDFFTAGKFLEHYTEKAKVVTTVSMFYDLPDPVAFARDIKSILHPSGIWVTEQSYCVTMLENNSFDTICHEHLEYYTLKQFEYIANAVGLKIVDVGLNSCNGGSFRVTLCHQEYDYPISDNVQLLHDKEISLNDITLHEFTQRCHDEKEKLMTFLRQEKENGKTIYLYGASTKGNTLLQYYDLNNTIITAAAERNPEKYGRRTPGTQIPIISEKEMREAKPDYLLVLPWHFKAEFLEREKEFLAAGGKIIFPLPEMQIY